MIGDANTHVTDYPAMLCGDPSTTRRQIVIAHITIDEVPMLLLLVTVAFASGSLSYMVGRRSAR
jgi:hypothetical protein